MIYDLDEKTNDFEKKLLKLGEVGVKRVFFATEKTMFE